MILIYVYGSGLGHLKRVSDFLCIKNINPEECVILTNSSYHHFWENSWQVIYLEDEIFKQKKRFCTLFKKICKEYSIQELIVDVFPLGFYGELTDCLLTFKKKKTLLARILSGKYFTCYSSPFYYDTIYILEKGVDHNKYLGKEKINLQLPYQLGNPEFNYPLFKYFLIIHSQPESEIDVLYKTALMYRTSQKIIIVSMMLPGNKFRDKDLIIFHQKQVSLELIKHAEIVFSALGFNSYRLLGSWKEKWKPIPFPRKFDNQFLRKQVNDL
ncbi:hypothetical protein O2K51_07945 [Apibacter raozihei]|uniref:hypothetical protein n=1 Tax=Apibacter raozihei TaxID=2500547 RepID=UPI000FE2E577|nr:hypothetical protein [Apibacter raozihei]